MFSKLYVALDIFLKCHCFFIIPDCYLSNNVIVYVISINFIFLFCGQNIHQFVLFILRDNLFAHS